MRDRPDHAAMVRRELVDVGRVVRALGLEKGAKREGRGMKVLCPAHGERTPSCSVRIAGDGTIAVKCFGCDLAGDVFSLVAAVRGLDVKTDFPAVLLEAAELAGVDLGDEQHRARGVSPATFPVQPRPEPPPVLELAVFDRLASIMLEACPAESDDGVREYLRTRLLLGEARADGWAALPANATVRRELVAKIVSTIGVDAWRLSGLASLDEHDFAHTEHRLIIPWRDPAGLVQTVQRRALDGRRNKYVFPSKRGAAWPYGVDVLAAHPDVPVLLVEGAVDVLAVRARAAPGWRPMPRPYVPIGLPGVGAKWIAPWSTLLEGRSVCIGFDRDDAGEKRARELAVELQQVGLRFADPWRVRPSTTNDWGASLEREFDGKR